MAGCSQHPVQIMENQTRFDLNAAIENWRQELAAQPNLASDDRRELETHLRDAIAGFQQCGLNDEESFWLARKRVGQPQQLGEEFVKADPAKIWRERILWICMAVFLLGILNDVIGSLIRAILPLKISSPLNLLSTIYEIPFLSSILVPLIIVILVRFWKMIPLFSKLVLLVESRSRFAITALILIIISTTISTGASAMYNARINYPADHSFLIPIGQGFYSDCIYKLIIVLLIVWLIPQQNRKTPKCA
jgi:hypothetical protein